MELNIFRTLKIKIIILKWKSNILSTTTNVYFHNFENEIQKLRMENQHFENKKQRFEIKNGYNGDCEQQFP